MRPGLPVYQFRQTPAARARIPWTVSDGDDGATQLLDELATAQRDRQAGQAYRVEVWAEAMGWLPRLEGI